MNRGFRGFPLKRPGPTSFNGLKNGVQSGLRGFPTNQTLSDWEFNTRMVLNLQSYSRNYFNLGSASAINQWTDLSPMGNHAVGTSTSRPTYADSDITFDGTNDFLQLNNEIQLPGDFSIYLVYRKTALSNNKIIFGSSVAPDNYYQLNNSNQTLTIAHTASGENANSYMCGGMLGWQVLSIRRNNGVYVIKLNDRLVQSTSVLITNTPLTRIGLIGKRIAGASIDGHYRAFCVSERYFDDTEDQRVRNYLYSKYNMPTDVFLIGLGDSITFQDQWFTDLGTALGLPSINQGLSGTLLSDIGANFPEDSMRRRFLTKMVTPPYTDFVTIVGGTNDILNGVSASVYSSNLSQIINLLINIGYNCRNIGVGSAPYQTGGANASTLDLYRTETVAVTSNFNTRYADLLQAMRDNGGDTLMADSLHPNAAGGVVIKDAFVTAFTGP